MALPILDLVYSDLNYFFMSALVPDIFGVRVHLPHEVRWVPYFFLSDELGVHLGR